jgi:hypothetical protein
MTDGEDRTQFNFTINNNNNFLVSGDYKSYHIYANSEYQDFLKYKKNIEQMNTWINKTMPYLEQNNNLNIQNINNLSEIMQSVINIYNTDNNIREDFVQIVNWLKNNNV